MGANEMIKSGCTVLGVFAIITAACMPAHSFSLGFSAVGGLGVGYYSMSELNSHISTKRQDLGITLDELTSGINFRLEGRVWVMDFAGVAGGYEYFWGETSSEGTSTSITFRTPADVYTVGAIVPIIRIKNAFDVCLGANWCFAKAVFEMKEETDVSRIIPGFKGDDSGFEAYAEAQTKFFNPIEIGFQLGYRGIKISSLTSVKDGSEATFADGTKVEIDYSGAFFSLTAAIRL